MRKMVTVKTKSNSLAWVTPPTPRCQRCKKTATASMRQNLRIKGVFMGPCGDSFCYASCDSPACHPVNAVLCDTCFKEVSK